MIIYLRVRSTAKLCTQFTVKCLPLTQLSHVMNNFFKILFRKQGIRIALYLVVTLILVDTFLTYRYKLALNENIEVQEKLEVIASQKATIISNLNNIDMSLR